MSYNRNPWDLDSQERQPLFDPDPRTFVGRDADSYDNWKLCRLSDFVCMALAVLAKHRTITRVTVNSYEVAFTKNTDIRKNRNHVGHPALAPDRTVITIDGEPFNGGDDTLKLGRWTLEKVNSCPGYVTWLKRLQQTAQHVKDNGLQPNTPHPKLLLPKLAEGVATGKRKRDSGDNSTSQAKKPDIRNDDNVGYKSIFGGKLSSDISGTARYQSSGQQIDMAHPVQSLSEPSRAAKQMRSLLIVKKTGIPHLTAFNTKASNANAATQMIPLLH